MSYTIQNLRKALKESIDSTPEKVSIFFKTEPGGYSAHDKFIGISVPTLRKIAKNFTSLIFDDLSILIQSPINEERLLALIILTNQYKCASNQQKAEIYQFYKDNISYVNNWNLVDSSAHLIIGAHLFDKNSDFLAKLAKSNNLWERRISIVSTLYFIRKGNLECTFEIATILLNDKHDLIHKAVGWMLREAGKVNQNQLIQFLNSNMHTMPRTMLRYAIEKLSKIQRKKYLTESKTKSTHCKNLA